MGFGALWLRPVRRVVVKGAEGTWRGGQREGPDRGQAVEAFVTPNPLCVWRYVEFRLAARGRRQQQRGNFQPTSWLCHQSPTEARRKGRRTRQVGRDFPLSAAFLSLPPPGAKFAFTLCFLLGDVPQKAQKAAEDKEGGVEKSRKGSVGFAAGLSVSCSCWACRRFEISLSADLISLSPT